METEAESVVQLATFRVGDDDYALDIMQIREIVNPLPVRAVRQAPAFVEGLIELRGTVVPVVDLRKRFGVEATPPTRRTKFIVVTHAGRAVALVVDEVGVLRVKKGTIREAPEFVAKGDASYFSGVVNSGGKLYLVLRLDVVLGTAEPIDVSAFKGAAAEADERK